MIRGYLMIAANYFGYAIPIILFGGLGTLMCKPGMKRRGFFVGASICAILMLVGQARPDQQQSCPQIGQSIRLSEYLLAGSSLKRIRKRRLEFQGDDGFFTQVIRDQAGQNQVLTLKDVAEF